MLKKAILIFGAVVCFAASGLPQGDARRVANADVIAARQASLDMSAITFRYMSDAMKTGREAKSQAYAAASLAKWAKALPRMFPAGTGEGETAVHTQALPAVWHDRAGFEEAAADYATATGKLAALASANDTPGFTKQLDEVNKACNSCHASYKGGDQSAPKK